MPAHDTIWEAVRRYEKAGFANGFAVRRAGRIMCLTCRKEHDADRVAMLALHRLEGASDPEDQAAVAALECPSCKSRGTLVLGYGSTASAEDRLAISQLRDQRAKETEGLRPGM